jgi:hypothetical protein
MADRSENHMLRWELIRLGGTVKPVDMNLAVICWSRIGIGKEGLCIIRNS